MSTQILLYSSHLSAGMYVICYFWLWPVHHKWILDRKPVPLLQHTWHQYREPQPLGRQATTARSGANTVGYHCSEVILYIKSLVASVRLSVTVSLRPSVCDRQSWEPNIDHDCLWPPVVTAKYRGPKTQVLRDRSWEPNAATRQQQKKRVAAPNRTCMASKIRDDGGCGHCNTKFSG